MLAGAGTVSYPPWVLSGLWEVDGQENTQGEAGCKGCSFSLVHEPKSPCLGTSQSLLVRICEMSEGSGEHHPWHCKAWQFVPSICAVFPVPVQPDPVPGVCDPHPEPVRFQQGADGRTGDKRTVQDCSWCGWLLHGCGHAQPEAGESSRFSCTPSIRDSRAMPAAAAALGRLSQGHIPVPWVMAARLDVVLIKLPSGALTKCSLKKSK